MDLNILLYAPAVRAASTLALHPSDAESAALTSYCPSLVGPNIGSNIGSGRTSGRVEHRLQNGSETALELSFTRMCETETLSGVDSRQTVLLHSLIVAEFRFLLEHCQYILHLGLVSRPQSLEVEMLWHSMGSRESSSSNR